MKCGLPCDSQAPIEAVRGHFSTHKNSHIVCLSADIIMNSFFKTNSDIL